MSQLGYDDFYDNNTPQAQADANLYVKFYYKTRKNKARDIFNPDHADMPEYVEVEYYDIKIPGERDSVAGAVNENIKQRFPRHYAAFKQRMEAPEDGFALKDWAAITRAQVEELAFKNIKTVEQLANVADSSAVSIRGLATLKQKAKAHIEGKRNSKFVDALNLQLEDRDKTISALEDRLNIMEKRFIEGDEPTNKRRKVK